MPSPAIDCYAVIGNPIAQSRSPEIHAYFAEQTGWPMRYTRLLAPLDGFVATVQRFREEGGLGLNVTAPFKVQAYELADHASEHARMAGAANCLRFREGRIEAENFDGVGLVADLERNLGMSLRGGRVLLLGAGGASRGVMGPLLAAEIAQLVIANRSVQKAEALVELFRSSLAVGQRLAAVSMEAIANKPDLDHQGFDLVIDGTSAPLHGEELRLASEVFKRHGLAYSMSYGKGLTPFLDQALRAGARIADGLGMLVEQAAASYAWWRGVQPSTQALLEQMRKEQG